MGLYVRNIMSNKKPIEVSDLLTGAIYESDKDLLLLVSKDKNSDGLIYLKWYSLKHGRLIYGHSCYGANKVYADLIVEMQPVSSDRNKPND